MSPLQSSYILVRFVTNKRKKKVQHMNPTEFILQVNGILYSTVISVPYATLFLTNMIKYSTATHIKHPCGCATIATTYAKVKSTPTTKSGDTVISGDYSQAGMAVPRGKEGKKRGLLPQVKALPCFGLRQKE